MIGVQEFLWRRYKRLDIWRVHIARGMRNGDEMRGCSLKKEEGRLRALRNAGNLEKI